MPALTLFHDPTSEPSSAVHWFALDIDLALDELIGPFPRVVRWLERLREREAYRLSHAAWNAVVPRIRELLLNTDQASRDPAWVVDACMPHIEGSEQQ